MNVKTLNFESLLLSFRMSRIDIHEIFINMRILRIRIGAIILHFGTNL